MKNNLSSYEGLQSNVRKLKTPDIEAWENQYPDKKYQIDIEIPEFTCVCPNTGLPDFAVLKISYSPRKWCIELKSFKLYLINFRDVGIFHEHVVNRILDDLVKVTKPRWMTVVGDFNARGGIETTVTAEYGKRKI
jgi:7-cyano-7-deazaguanine reductase